MAINWNKETKKKCARKQLWCSLILLGSSHNFTCTAIKRKKRKQVAERVEGRKGTKRKDGEEWRERQGHSNCDSYSSYSCESSGFLTIKQGNSTHNAVCGFPPKGLEQGTFSMICFFEPITFLCTSLVGDLLHSNHAELAIMKICFENCCVFLTILIYVELLAWAKIPPLKHCQ